MLERESGLSLVIILDFLLFLGKGSTFPEPFKPFVMLYC